MHIAVALAAAASLQVGGVAPDFEVKDAEGNTLQLSEMVQSETVVLAFFPKAFTPGCTQEMKNYTKLYEDLRSRGAQVLAVSMDDAETLRKFKASLEAPFVFVPDPEGTLSQAYGVAKKGSKWASRKTFVIGEDRRILATEEGGDAVDPDAAVAACPMRGPAEG